MLFYSDWALGYHNQEAERKARFFSRAGYDVVYMAGVGTRNPRPRSARKLLDRLARKLRGARQAGAAANGLRTAPLLVLPPRQLRLVRRLNVAWVRRQLRAAIPDWENAVAWVRVATPELVDALATLHPVIVYEALDGHHASPGMTGVWRDIFERAERSLVAQSRLVIVASPAMGERFEAWGARVREVPHGVDLFPWRQRNPAPGDPPVLGFLGVLDARLDQDALEHIARARPDWRLRLIGPIERGFDAARFDRLPNVSVEPPVPHEAIGERLAELDVGLLAYGDYPAYRYSLALKHMELLAAGRPAVARPTAALERYGDLLYFATTPEQFVDQIERALREDSPELAAKRRAVAEQQTWEHRLDELAGLLEEALASPTSAPGP